MSNVELIEEIKNISRQYQAEVGRTHKAWPKAIRERVVELLEDGINANRISKATGISYHTVLKWRSVKGKPRGRVQKAFKELSVSSCALGHVNVMAAAQKVDTQKMVVDTAAQKLARVLEDQVQSVKESVPITTLDGFRIELPCVDAAIDFIVKLRKIGG